MIHDISCVSLTLHKLFSIIFTIIVFSNILKLAFMFSVLIFIFVCFSNYVLLFYSGNLLLWLFSRFSKFSHCSTCSLLYFFAKATFIFYF